MKHRYDAPDELGDQLIGVLLGRFPILRYFRHTHLPQSLQDMSRPFHKLAWHSASVGVNIPEVAAGLRKLLEAKDCIVRSILPEEV